MRSKISLNLSLLIVSIVGVAFSSIIIFSASNTSNQTQRNLINDKSVGFIRGITYPEQAPSGFPIRLKIPTINVDAAVERVGLTPDGAMDIPKNYDNIAWFELGSRPGENGSAVIAGHSGWIEGKPSVFDNLYKLRPGDKLYLEDDKGMIISFVVRENRRYDPKSDASEVFNLNNGKSHLNLVTCEGAWNKVTKSYPSRLVVFTDKE